MDDSLNDPAPMEASEDAKTPTPLGAGPSSCASVVGAQTDKVIEGFKGFAAIRAPPLQKLIAHLEMLKKEILDVEDPEQEVNVVAEDIFDRELKKIDNELTLLADEHRNMHRAVSKVGKEIERNFVSQVTGLVKNERNFTGCRRLRRKLDVEIRSMLLSRSEFEVAAEFTQEAGVTKVKQELLDPEEINVKEEALDEAVDSLLSLPPIPQVEQMEGASTEAPFVTLSVEEAQECRKIVEEFRNRNVMPALEWLAKQNSDDATELSLILHRAHVLIVADRGEKAAAIKHCQKYLARDPNTNKQELMAAVVRGSAHKAGQYEALVSPLGWTRLEKKLSHVLSRTDCPLEKVLEAGIKALPPLLNLRQAMAQRTEHLFSGEELPIETPVEHIHSTFTCPIMKQQTTETNPPMRLQCGHAISKEALNRLAQTSRHFRLKCPYCPAESAVTDAKRLYF